MRTESAATIDSPPSADTPDAGAFDAALRQAQQGEGAAAPDYRVATNNEVWPPATDMNPVAVPEAATAEHPELAAETLAFEADGKTVVVRREDNPGLYGYAEAISQIAPAEMQTLRAEKLDVLRGGDQLPLADIATWVGYEGGNLWKLELEGGRSVMVHRDLTPELFDKASAVIKGYDDGYAMADSARSISGADLESARILPPNEAQGFIGVDLNGERIHVSRDVNPALYDRAVAQYDAAHAGETTAAVDEARRASDLPTASELDIGQLATTEADPKDDKRKLTVNELTWQNLIKSWKDGIDKGSIAPDDERAQLYRAVQAKGAAEDGLNMVGLDMASGQSLNHATAKDFDTIIDGDKADARIAELMASDAVGRDLAAERKASLGKVEGGADIARRLEEMAFGDDYLTHLAALQKDGKGDLAKDDIAATFDALLMVDPEKAAKFAQEAEVNALTIDLDELIANPDLVSQENLTTATQDTGKVILQVLKKLGVDAGRRFVESEKFLNEVLRDKQTAGNFGKAMQELGALYSQNGLVTGDDIQRLLGSGGKYQSLNDATDGGALKAISEMNGNGLLGSAGGLISLASGIYQLAGKGGTLADTPEERLGIAKEFVSFVGAGRHFVNFGTRMTDFVNGTGTNQLLGLDKSLPDLFGERSGRTGGGLNMTPEVKDDFLRHVDAAIALSDDPARLAGAFGNVTEADAQKLIDGMAEGYERRPNLPEGSTKWHRGASAVLQVLDAGANSFVGVADAVIGGLTIRNGIASGSDETIAKGALQVASGAFGTAGGIASFAGLAGLNAVKAAAAPSFLISAVLSVATLIPDIIQDEKNRQKMDAHREQLQELFTALDADGLLRQDGLDHYRYLDASIYTFGQRDAPDDVGIFDYRSEEVSQWLEKWNSTEWARDQFTTDVFFEDLDHKDYGGDGDNIWTDLDDNG
jgi:hypothetical protein